MTIQLTIAALFLFSAFYGAPMNEPTPNALPKMDKGALQDTLVHTPITLEQYVREYFKDVPLMAEIARCESRFRHFSKNGEVLRGKVATEDIGVMQINEFYHEDTAKVLELDLHTLEGNLAYAKWLYSREGFAPWASSSKCWQKPDALVKAGIETAQLN